MNKFSDMYDTLSFVLPFTLEEELSNEKWRKDVDTIAVIRFRMVIKSFLINFDLNDLEIFLIICPKKDITNIKTQLSALTTDNRFKIVDENEIYPHLKLRSPKESISGWYIQQILKLTVAKVIKTDFYLTLDSDVICKNRFNRSTLVPSGKALLNIETSDDYHELYMDSFATKEWAIKNNRLRLSAILINYRRKTHFQQQSYGETPVLMHCQSVLGLMEELSYLYRDWVTVLLKISGWTEYTLYFQYLEKHNLIDTLYIKKRRNTLLDLDSSVWFPSSFYKNKRCVTPESVLHHGSENGIFVVIQSYLDEKTWLPDSISDTKTFYSMLEKSYFN